jgi:hypothetical protein
LLLKYLTQLNLPHNARIFVPLSGKSVDMLWLAKQGYQVIGVELSQEACQLFFSEYDIPYQQIKKGKFTVFIADKITIFAGDFFGQHFKITPLYRKPVLNIPAHLLAKGFTQLHELVFQLSPQ